MTEPYCNLINPFIHWFDGQAYVLMDTHDKIVSDLQAINNKNIEDAKQQIALAKHLASLGEQ